MSFSANVKNELCRIEVVRGCCARAELLGVLLYANTFSRDGIRIVTENRDFGARLPRLLYHGAGLNFDSLPDEMPGKRNYCVTDAQKISEIFNRCGFSAESSLALHVNLALLERECCRKAFLRGAFLAGGSVTDPEKRYHLELSTTHRKVSRETEALMMQMELLPKQTERKGSSVLYLKQSDAIEDFLALIGAPVSAMAVMQAKIEKEWRNTANRKTNCDAANVDKTVSAAQEQLAAIRRLEQTGQLATLPDKLRSTAAVRMEHPEASLGELAGLHTPPLSKSAINHRLRRLMMLAAQEE